MTRLGEMLMEDGRKEGARNTCKELIETAGRISPVGCSSVSSCSLLHAVLPYLLCHIPVLLLFLRQVSGRRYHPILLSQL